MLAGTFYACKMMVSNKSQVKFSQMKLNTQVQRLQTFLLMMLILIFEIEYLETKIRVQLLIFICIMNFAMWETPFNNLLLSEMRYLVTNIIGNNILAIFWQKTQYLYCYCYWQHCQLVYWSCFVIVASKILNIGLFKV